MTKALDSQGRKLCLGSSSTGLSLWLHWPLFLGLYWGRIAWWEPPREKGIRSQHMFQGHPSNALMSFCWAILTSYKCYHSQCHTLVIHSCWKTSKAKQCLLFSVFSICTCLWFVLMCASMCASVPVWRCGDQRAQLNAYPLFTPHYFKIGLDTKSRVEKLGRKAGHWPWLKTAPVSAPPQVRGYICVHGYLHRCWQAKLRSTCFCCEYSGGGVISPASWPLLRKYK